MRAKGTILTLLCFWVTMAVGQDTTFVHAIGGTGYDYGRDVHQTFDGGFIITGSTGSFGFGNSEMYIVKIDSFGNYEWSKTYGTPETDRGIAIEQTPDSGFITVGYTNSFGAGGYDVYLVRIDKNGDSLWTKTYGGSDWDLGFGVKPTADGGYIIVGETYSFGNGDNDVYLIKTDSVGDTLWTKTYGGNGSDFGRSIALTSDGGYIIGGGTSSFGAGKLDVYAVKTTANGDTIWTSTSGGIEDDWGNVVVESIDGNFYSIVGVTESFGSGKRDFYIVGFDDTTGTQEWNSWFGGIEDEEGNDLVQNPDGSYGLIGYTKSFGKLPVDFVFYKTTSTGVFLASATLGDESTEIGRAIDRTYDGGYVYVGSTDDSLGNGYYDIIIYKTRSNGVTDTTTLIPILDNLPVIPVAIDNIESQSHIELFPNPFSDKAVIKIVEGNYRNLALKLYSLEGKEIDINYSAYENMITIYRKSLPAGMYLFTIWDNTIIIGKGKAIVY